MKLEETLEIAAETTGVGTWHWFLEDDLLVTSPICRAIFGRSANENFQFVDFLAAVHPDDRKMVEQRIADAIDPSGTGFYEVDFRIVRSDSTVHWLNSRGRVFFEGSDKFRRPIRFIGTALDRTKWKLMQDALVEAEKLAVIGRFASSIAHEIRNPLETVQNLLYLMRTEESDEQRSRYFQDVEDELCRLAEIVDNTLRFSRDPNTTTLVDLGEIVERVINFLRHRITMLGVTTRIDIRCDMTVIAPKGEIRQVVVNLISNALDAMPNGGRLIVRGRRKIDLSSGERFVMITIADTGSGMSAEVMKNIFNAFYTTKGSSGTGLGLWLCREITRNCGAKLKVRSQLEQGTVFQLTMRAMHSSSESTR